MRGKLTFAEWMKAVDAACYRLCGASVHDLADICFADLYDDGVSPAGAARRAIRAMSE
jgi:hypothetical protein